MDRKELMSVVGARIRYTRQRMKLSRSKLAQRVGVSMNGIAMIERGEVDPRIGTLHKIAEQLDVEVEDFLTRQFRIADLPTS